MIQATRIASPVQIVPATDANMYTVATDNVWEELLTMPEYIEKFTVVNRLIDLENEFQQYKPFHGFEHAMYRKICEAEIAIGKTPAAEVALVRHGRWIDKPTGRYGQWQAWCSECNERCGCGGTIESQHKRFCPNCGAKMDLEAPDV